MSSFQGVVEDIQGVSSFHGVVVEFHSYKVCLKEFHCIQGVLISGCCRGVPLYAEVSSFQGVVEEFH